MKVFVFFVLQLVFATVVQLTNNTTIKFCSVALCFVFAGLFFVCKRRHVLIVPALFFTVAADVFMVLYQMFLPAVLLFCVVQGIYFVLLLQIAKKREALFNTFLRVVLTAVLEIAAVLFLRESFNLLIFVCAVYYAFLLSNVIFAGMHFWDYPQLFLGLLLFLLCDTSIGFIFLNNYIPVSSGPFGFLMNGSFNYVWFFYNISQFLLALMPIVPKNPIKVLKTSFSDD